MSSWRLGTMGFSYAEWNGVFYPRDLKASEYLPFYARYFDTLELDTTFHATPAEHSVRRWKSVTPDEFQFCVKSPREVTHDSGLDRAAEPMLRFLDVMRGLGDKLAVVLLQFPPALESAALPQLDAFLAKLPTDLRYAVEFRHPSWAMDGTTQVLRGHNVCWATADYLDEPTPMRVTSDFLYVRWVGVHGRFPEMDHEVIDVSERLKWWHQQLLQVPARVKTVYGFFNNDYAGYSIASCQHLRDLLGMDARIPTAADRGELFA